MWYRDKIQGPAPSPEQTVEAIANVFETVRAWEISQKEARDRLDLILRWHPIPTRITYKNTMEAYHDHLGLIVRGMRLSGTTMERQPWEMNDAR